MFNAKSKMINFSIIIPVYNKAYAIPTLIKSLAEQTYTHFEIIFVNDGSTDDSLQLLIKETKKYKALVNKFVILSQANHGVSRARNHGILNAKNEYLCLLDADDFWQPDYLETLKSLINDYPDAAVFSLGHDVLLNNQKILPHNGLPIGYRGYIKNFFLASIRGDVINSSKVCIKKSALLTIKLFPENAILSEDLQVWCLLALKYKIATHLVRKVSIVKTIDHARLSRVGHVPYPIIFFGQHTELLTLSIRLFLFKIALAHVILSLSQENYYEAKKRSRAFKPISYIGYMALNCLFFLPRFLLKKLLNRGKKST
ncbi:glycosyltransferase family 2 protein [Wohlfahrtiimonas chitiniclastica]|uniref:glycosyltransferase family 2 protein n=1 Tax=Wohlfahrtiimonas chitiniclastica TaxID=400946 RepID=UPI000B16260F|nr:glycosyltransferase family 2 protein [Wohlfahrtiimonas chitiniclastica]MBS7834571.1 glycosyltransferase family 2 protein [Wohlfahrtiimonas chitiniclastica]